MPLLLDPDCDHDSQFAVSHCGGVCGGEGLLTGQDGKFKNLVSVSLSPLWRGVVWGGVVGSYSLDEVSGQGLLADGLLRQRQPELTGLQGHVLICILRTLEHVLEGHRERTLVHEAFWF